MIKEFINNAKSGNTIYISTVREAFDNLPEPKRQTFHCILNLLEDKEKRSFNISVPVLEGFYGEEIEFIESYVWARIYNVLSSLGGRSMDIFANEEDRTLVVLLQKLNKAFCIDDTRKERQGYGRCINVTDRMLEALFPELPGFQFRIHTMKEYKTESFDNTHTGHTNSDNTSLLNATKDLKGKDICGIDVGGTDIKIVMVRDEKIDCYKEYDWFPASFIESGQLVEPICMIIRLLRAKASLDDIENNSPEKTTLTEKVKRALEKDADNAYINSVIEQTETFLQNKLVFFDAIGLCFPDVVVRNKIVGGEVYKTRGIRNNNSINYEEDFKMLTNLDTRLKLFCKYDASVQIINDGPMAAFTAAIENIAAKGLSTVKQGVFAHTLGTELGTGWLTGSGEVPDIPLEIYNCIIDLGSFTEKHYMPDDLRSVNNFNTSLSGTLQKYTSQSGVFRLAMKYFPEQRPDLFNELIEKGFVVKNEINGQTSYCVPTEPTDQRKPFLEHMMMLPEREKDAVNERIWREIGEFLAVASLEMDHILSIETPIRILFGRLIKNRRCFELIKEGANSISRNYIFESADMDMANTCLMKQLKIHPVYTVAQFAQAVGAAYFGNYGLRTNQNY